MRRTLAAAGRQLTRCHALVEASPAQHRGWDGASAGGWATSRQLRWFGEGWGREMTIHTRDWSFQEASEPRRGLARLGVDAFAASPRVGIRSDGASPASLSRGYAASHSLWVGGNASDRVDATARETDEDADRRSSGDATSASHDGGFTRAPEAERTWVDETLPPSVVPYAKLVRLDRPAGVYLLAWPCLWSIALAAPPGCPPDPYLSSLFCAGAFLLRGAGCTVNDLWDRDIDALVARTRNRPIASGAVSPTAATVFLGAQLLAGLGILLRLNDFSVALGASSLALVAAYPAMKRVTNWPQAFLGLTFNWGALLGYAAVHGQLDPMVCAPLYASGVFWTLLYDTVYAHQDAADDEKIGVKSTALRLREMAGGRAEGTKKYLAMFGAASTAGLCAAGHAAGVGPVFYVGAAASAAHLAWQVRDVNLDDGEDCASKFRSNGTQYGAIVFAACVAGKLSGV